ncbi:DUF2194 domain-containing protein [candidate division KSB1 bacterium]|nr:DUF2194 domain-containing protein [candidate division KSB1 bacterium]
MDKKCIFIILIIISFFLNSSPELFAQSKSLLILYKGSEGFSTAQNPFRNNLHQAFGPSDYQLEYHDIEKFLPDKTNLTKYSAVITWFTSPVMKNPEQYLEWLNEQIYNRRKVVIIDNPGAFSADGQTWLSEMALNRFFLTFGVEFKGQWTANPDLIEIIQYNSELIGQDISVPDKKLNNYFKFNSINPKNQAILTLNRKDIVDGTSPVIVKTPFGGMALQGFTTEVINNQQRYFLNIKRFIDLCLISPIQTTDLPGKKILALLKRSESNSANESLIHRYAFKSLLEMGYTTSYHFIEDGLPDEQTMCQYSGILTWFQTAEMQNGLEYLDWLLKQINQRRKVIILGNLGCFKSQKFVPSPKNENLLVDWWITWPELNNFLYPFGLEFLGGWIGDAKIMHVRQKDAVMVEKDIQLLQKDLTHYYSWRSVHPENKIFLEVERTDQPNSASAFILRTPYGGMAFEGYLMQWDAAQNQIKFRLNLPAFLKECLTYQTETVPRSIRLITHQEIYEKEIPQLKQQQPKKVKQSISIPTGSSEIKRWILAFYDSRENSTLENNPIHNNLEIVLNHLGLVLTYHDIQNGLPAPEKMEKYRGIISWFYNPVHPNPVAYAQWLTQQIRQGRKVVILGNYGAYLDEDLQSPTRYIQAFFNELGLRYWDVKIDFGVQQKVVYKNEKIFDFEKPLDFKKMDPIRTRITSNHPKNKIYLSLSDSRAGQIDAVVVTPSGAIALGETPYQEAKNTAEWRNNFRQVLQGQGNVEVAEKEPLGFWRINPFQFFAQAFDVADLPIPDITTLYGSRIFYSHIDGDGLTGISLIDSKSYASEFVRDQIIKAYPLPFSASVISREIETKGFPYYNRPYSVAKSIFELENVEAATHSYTHPYNWRKGDIDVRFQGENWSWETLKINYEMEVPVSVRFIEKNLLPPHKKLNVYLWSGQCNPDERALSWTEKLGIENLNGGDPIYDQDYPTYSKLAPFAFNKGDFWQIYTSASNDFIYTNGWTRNFGNMAKLVDYFEHTETPIRIMPLNIYIHFYIGDRQAGLDGLKKAYNYCMKQQIAPIFASEFSRIVKDFINLRQFKIAEAGYKIFHDNALRTIRFDQPKKYPDFEKSVGIIGFSHYQNSLYIYLDEKSDQIIYLAAAPPRSVYLKYGSHYVDNWKAAAERVTFHVSGLGKASFEIANLLPDEKFQVEIHKLTESTPTLFRSGITQSSKNGNLKFETIFKGYAGKYAIVIQKVKS